MDNNEVLTLDLSKLQRRKINIKEGDETRELYLNVSDVNIVVRFKEKYEELKNLEKNAFSKNDETKDDIDAVLTLAQELKEIDLKMREILDYIFDSNVSEVCAPHGSMYDPINGEMRYEHIISALSTLYEANLAEEAKKVNARINKHTSKYTKK